MHRKRKRLRHPATKLGRASEDESRLPEPFTSNTHQALREQLFLENKRAVDMGKADIIARQKTKAFDNIFFYEPSTVPK